MARFIGGDYMITLGIDTSTMRTSVGIVSDGEEIASYEITSSVNNSEDLVEMISEIFKKLDITIKDVDLFAVGVGPGSFTGTRIAVTVARTFAQTLDKEIIGVSSLKSLCLNYSGEGLLIPLIDARRNRAYFGLYKNEKDLVTIKEDNVEDIDILIESIKEEKLVLLGKGAEKFADKFKEKFSINLPLNREIKGSNIARLGEIEYKKKGSQNLFEVLPNYINKSQAEREFEKRKKK